MTSSSAADRDAPAGTASLPATPPSGPLLPYLSDLEALLPGAAIEEVGERRELVIYTGLAVEVYDPAKDEWLPTSDGRLVPFPDELDR